MSNYNTFQWDKKQGFKFIGQQPNVMNVLTTHAQNICVWYDGIMRPMKGHDGTCRWEFDGQVWYHV